MAEAPFYSSQGSHYERHRILQEDQENIASSPPRSPNVVLRSSALRPKALPTVTPKRFTKFFTPRPSLPGRGGRPSKAGRQLRDITKNGANRRRQPLSLQERLLGKDADDTDVCEDLSTRPQKRQRLSLDLQSSPPMRSSPLKHVQISLEAPAVDGNPRSPMLSDDDVLTDLFDDLQPFPQRIRRLAQTGPSHRILQRSFGATQPSARSSFRSDDCADPQSQTANFVSAPTDINRFTGTALPFCSASCHTNSLIAIGDEEGSVRLLDTAPSSSFTTAHLNFRVHHNAIMDLAFNSSDYLLATAGGDQTARIVDMHTQQTSLVFSGHTSSVKQVRFQPNSDNMLTTSGRDGTVQIWDLRVTSRGSVQSLRPGQWRRSEGGNDDDGVPTPAVHNRSTIHHLGPAHRSATGTSKASAASVHSEDAAVSITGIQHLPHGREHILLTTSELNASVQVWDLRSAGRRTARSEALPLSATLIPAQHRRTRNYGVNAMTLSGDGARLYTVCRDSAIYAYSTNHLVLGQAPELESRPQRRAYARESKPGVGPLYALRHPDLRVGSFYVKTSLRPAVADRTEMLAVGSTDGCAVLFPTDERHHTRSHPEDEDEDELPTASPPSLPTHDDLGTALVKGHGKEVTSLCWTHSGDELVTIGDDFRARCWREDAEEARLLRGCGEGQGRRWGCGWAAVRSEWDEDEC